ncbi:SDR family NAD(P)-dependent oxidoreductase [Micromonospora sp. HUAS LYJ1]|uniref:SDR family NAD(P)-dependent oxidoreductase n=1 Tax=Micromonospora sp. HUAS LYJ1 TaxID=3061626 RepID=UPI002671050E|nr:SDR family oxidoreductase [Micromonospora sp. HUAS LYJ1]WKU05474.1 SDR family oxidoreductase [Micromonospora sp. HUAS LYJ1]
MADRLKGKVAVITGAASGIGRGGAELFVAEGAKVVAADINDELGAALQKEYAGSLVYVHADVTSEADIAAAVDTAVSKFGKLDIMFNNAGAQGDPSPLIEIGSEGFDKTIALLTRSVVLGHKYAARQFQRQGTGGSIVSTASAAGLQGGWSAAGYTIAKHAIVGIVRQAVVEFAPLGIRSNAIAPGIIRTPIMARSFGVPPDQADAFSDFLEEKLGASQPIGRLGLPSDIAEAALWLGSDASSFVTGIVLPVDGGATAAYAGGFAADVVAAANEFTTR